MPVDPQTPGPPAAAAQPAGRGRVRAIDFRRPTKYAREQVRQIERAHEGFARSASSRLSAEMRSDVQMGVAHSDQLPWSAVMSEGAAGDVVVAVLRVVPHGGIVTLTLPLELANHIVSRLLGGGDRVSPVRPEGLTEVEVAVVEVAVQGLVDSLSITWEELTATTFELVGMEGPATAAERFSMSEPTLVVVMDASIDLFAAQISLVLPHSSMALSLEGLRNGFAEEADERSAESMNRAVGTVDVEVRAEVGVARIRTADLLLLGVGDLIRLNRAAADGAVMHVDEVPVYRVQPGANGGVRAVQITALVDPHA